MALNGLYVKIDAIIEKVYMDYGFENDLQWTDALSWAADALDKIGAPRAFMAKITDGDDSRGHQAPIVISNYRGDLPCDLLQIVQTREYCSKIPMIYATDTFHSSCHISSSPDLKCNSNKNCVPKAIDEVPSTQTDDNTHCNPFFNFNPNPTSNTAYGANMPSVNSEFYGKELTYTVNGGKIFTSFKEGQVEMSYYAYPTDERGFPMIPAHTKYQEAVKNYIAHRISKKLAISGKLNWNIAQDLEQEWLFYCASAANQARMPSLDQMESLKNQWLRSIPNINEHETSFRNQNEPERRYIPNAR